MIGAVHVPDTLDAAISAAAEGGWLVAGGTAVMPEVNTTPVTATDLVSVRRLGLAGIEIDGDRATVGSATTLSALGEHRGLAFLHPALATIASPIVRNLATVGGNLFVKPPYGDLAACLLALEAESDVAGPQGSRSCPVTEIVQSGIGPGEIVTAVRFAVPGDGTWFYRKAMRRRLNSAAIVIVAAVVTQAGGRIDSASVALNGVAPKPFRARATEAALTGNVFDRATVEAAAEAARTEAAPYDDPYASAWYRDRVLPVHVRRALMGE